jgi:hypothetical protein
LSLGNVVVKGAWKRNQQKQVGLEKFNGVNENETKLPNPKA